MNRRSFLVSGAGLLAATLVRPAWAADVASPVSASWQERIAQDFAALDRSKIQLAGFLMATHPVPVGEAIERHRRELDANPTTYLYHNNRTLEREVRAVAGRHLGVAPNEIALTDSTTMGLGLVFGSIALKPGQELLATTHDHYVTHESMRLRAAKSGATFRKIRLYQDIGDVSADGIANSVREGLRDETRVLAVTWVHSSTGLKLPIRRIAAIVAEANAGRAAADRVLLCVDGVHGLAVEDVTLPELGCDVFVAGTHKWLCGPRGTGIVWANAAGRAALSPIIPSFSRGEGWGGLMTPGGFHSFEHRWALADAFRWHLERGKAQSEQHHHALARRVKEGLDSIGRVRRITPMDPDLSSGLVAFDVPGRSARGVERALLQAGVVTKRAPYERSYARIAPAIYTTSGEVDRALEAVERLFG